MTETVIVFDETGVDVNTRKAIYNLANHLHLTSEMVIGVQLSNISQGKVLINHIHGSFTNKSAVKSIILIQDSKSSMELFQLAEEDVVNILYFSVTIDDSISKRAEITKPSYITQIKLRKNGDNVVIDPFLFKDICKGMIGYNLFLIIK